MTSSADKKGGLSYKLTIRLYGLRDNIHESHSYLIDDCFTGVSSPLGDLFVNINTVTLRQLRPMIEYDRSNHMDKRSMMFQEALFLMSRMPNYFGRPKSELKEYQFGFLKKDRSEFKIIAVSDEDKVIGDLIGLVDFFTYDLCIVPLSQIDPTCTSEKEIISPSTIVSS